MKQNGIEVGHLLMFKMLRTATRTFHREMGTNMKRERQIYEGHDDQERLQPSAKGRHCRPTRHAAPRGDLAHARHEAEVSGRVDFSTTRLKAPCQEERSIPPWARNGSLMAAWLTRGVGH